MPDASPSPSLLPRAWEGVRRAADAVETSALGPGLWISCFAGIVALRHLLELLSSRLPVYHPFALLLHYPLAYLAPALTLAVILALLASWPVARVTRLMLAAAALLLLPPLVDLALPLVALLPGLPESLRSVLESHHEAPQVIGYLYEGDRGFLAALGAFLDPRRVLEGTTAGIRLEALLAAALGAAYVLLRRRAWWRALLTLPAVFLTAFLFFTLPSRFLDLLRLAYPGLSMDALYGGRGYLAGPGSLHDGISIFYLTALLGLVLLVWTVLHAGRRGLREGPGSLDWGQGVLSAALAGVGLAAALLTRGGLEGGLELSVYDHLALLSTVLASLLVTAGLGGERAARTAPLVGAALGLCFASAAGYPALAGALALAGTSWLASTAGPLVLGWPWLAAAGRALQGMAALSLGYLALAGGPGLAWIPGSLLLAALLTGLAAHLLARRVSGNTPGARLRAALPAASALVAVLCWPLLLGAPAPVLLVSSLFFGLALLAAHLGLPSGAERLLPPLVGACAAAAALLSLWSPVVREELVRSVLSLPSFHLDLGERYREAGDLREAERSFAMAAQLAPGDPEPAQRLGLLEVARAEEVLRARALPGLSGPETAEALERELRLRLEAAEAYFRAALEADPDSVQARYNLGTALLQRGELEAAEREMAGVLERKPGHAGALFQRAEALLSLGRKEEAADSLRRYLDVTERDPGQVAGRARARELLGRWLRAGGESAAP